MLGVEFNEKTDGILGECNFPRFASEGKFKRWFPCCELVLVSGLTFEPPPFGPKSPDREVAVTSDFVLALSPASSEDDPAELLELIV